MQEQCSEAIFTSGCCGTRLPDHSQNPPSVGVDRLKNGSSTLHKETVSEFLHPGEPQGVKKLDTPGRFAMLPATVLASEVSLAAKVVYAALSMQAMGRSDVASSHKALAKLCKISRPTVLAGISQLVEAKFIEASGNRVNSVQPYRLLAKTANRLTPTERNGVATSDKGRTAAARCIRCVRPSKLGPGGVCRACLGNERRERQYREAKSELGLTATHEEICQRIRVNRDSRIWLKIARRVESAA